MTLCKLAQALALLILVAHGASASYDLFPVVGRNFTIVNKNQGGLAQCPEGNPNYAAFFPDGVVKIRGNFAAADIGVCSKDLSVYAIPETETIRYEIYDDMIIFSVPDRVRSALRIFKQGPRKLAVHLSQNFEVSDLADVGRAQAH